MSEEIEEVVENATTDNKNNVEDPSTIKRLQLFATKEKDLRDQKEQLNTQQKAIDEYNKLMKSVRSNPNALLSHAGITAEDMKVYLDTGEMPEESKVDILSRQVDQLTKDKELSEKKKQEVFLTNYKSDLASMVNESKDYPLIQEMELQDTIFTLIEKEYGESGKILDPKDAAKQIEEYLSGLSDSSKKKKVVKKDTSDTLSNKLTTANLTEKPLDKLSESEKIARWKQMVS